MVPICVVVVALCFYITFLKFTHALTRILISCHKVLFTKLEYLDTYKNFDLMLRQPRPLVLDLTNLYIQ